MKNSDVKLNELISDLSQPARSIVGFTILSQKIRNHILSLKKKISNLFSNPIAQATHIETDDSHVGSRSRQEDGQFALHQNLKKID
jgi:hypothetical protein